MRWQIVLLLVSVALAAGEKKLEKRPTKKAYSLKPTKSPKSIIEEFTALPPADVDFIKELDRQFREHGNKIRIKVERSNATDGKNIKRTIEGDLGYGHYSNQPDSGYHFSKPKYMIYPYSQHDIPPVRSTHSTVQETVTDIEITPSHSYELKPIEEVYQVYPTQQYAQEQQQQQYYYHHSSPAQGHQQTRQLFHQQEDTPVIVLKIPGPSKYAAHLQALLQQYLEIRAAQLYKELEEHEYQQQQQLQLQHQQQHQQHYVQEQDVHHHHHLQQQQQQQQQEQQEHEQHHGHHTKTKYSQPDPVYPTEIAYVPMIRTSQNTYVPLPEQYYDTPKPASPRPTKHRKTTVTPTHVAYHSTVQPEPAYHYQTYHPEHQQHVQEPGHAQIQYQYVSQPAPAHEEEHEPQYVYEKPVVNFVTPVPEEAHHSHPDPYQQQQQHHHQPPKKYPNFAEYHHHHRPQQQQEEEYLPEPKLVENYPSHKHTRVIYKSPSLKAELQQEVAEEEQHEQHYHHQQQEVVHVPQQHHAHHHQQQQQHQQQYILQEVYPSQASYFEDKSFVESAGAQVTTDRSETVTPHYNTEPVVAITQKPKRLYNYHAHSSSGHHGSGGSRGSRMAAGGGRTRTGASGAKGSSKRDAASPYTEEEFRKVNKMVQRMKKKSRTTPSDDPGVTVRSSTSPSPRMSA
ncbi:transcription factor SPT20 homolog [Anopheles nili]|uniref:transcription factor SPT20 homolog n=1 Tax=Anopheles nili TaxID=185578 RepID=UPI00237AA22E|nr:transcription factor SPT20 homolog [Anopheles nili]